MVKIQRCKKHGVCNDCGKWKGGAALWEIKASITGQGWTTLTLCPECLLSLYKSLGAAALGL